MLSRLRVLDLSTEIAGPYCTKLLADAGADVIKVEPPEGDPMRRWTASGADLGNEDGALFRFLNTSKRSVLGDPVELVGDADVVVESGETDVGALRERRRHLVVVSITPFGRHGPWAGRPATEFTLQAWCGSTGSRGTPDGPPIHAGGRLGEWIGGAYAAVAAAAAARQSRRTGRGEHVDVSILECMAISLNTYASVFASFVGWPPAGGPPRMIELPSIAPTADGYVGFCTITAQQFQDFLVLIGHPQLVNDAELASHIGRFVRRREMIEITHAWTEPRTAAEVIEQASLLRIPVAPIGNGATVVEMDHFVHRKAFVNNPAGFVQPRVPYRISGPGREGRREAGLATAGRSARAGIETKPFAPAPRLGEHTGQRFGDGPRARVTTTPAGDADLPLAGVRILDFTAFWAGPAATHMLAALGADVIKVESIQRPDGLRFASVRPPSSDGWWEWGGIFHGANVGKRAITIDMNRPEGLELAKRLLERCDAVVENFTPRVMEAFGLDWPVVRDVNPRAVMVRMPAFGLDGPWRERTGFAQTMEQISGMAWITGLADGPPLIPRGACDPLAGMHAVFALIVALEECDRTGEGRLVEVTMVEAALNAAAEQVVEYSAYGALLHRAGNRGPVAAPQGLYRGAGDDQWLALAIASDEQWAALVEAMGRPSWALDAELSTAEGRRRAHDHIDDELAVWCKDRDVQELVEKLAAIGVPAAFVINPRDMVHNPQLRARGFVESITHPVVGTHDFPGIPFRFASRKEPWLRSPAPTLGQHNDEILGALGLGPEELQRLRDDHVIGERPLGL